MGIIDRFGRYYFGDQVLTRLEVDVQNQQVYMCLTGALLLKQGENQSMFDPELTIAPAVVRFIDCRELLVSQGSFAMNNTVVEVSAVPLADDRIEFRFSLTGGWNDGTFWRELTFVARDFTVSVTDSGR